MASRRNLEWAIGALRPASPPPPPPPDSRSCYPSEPVKRNISFRGLPFIKVFLKPEECLEVTVAMVKAVRWKIAGIMNFA